MYKSNELKLIDKSYGKGSMEIHVHSLTTSFMFFYVKALYRNTPTLMVYVAALESIENIDPIEILLSIFR